MTALASVAPQALLARSTPPLARNSLPVNAADILLAVPTRGLVDYQTIERLNLILDNEPGLPPILFEQGVMGAGEVRQRIVAQFLAGPWNRRVLIMVDDDVLPPANLLGIVEHLNGPNGYDVMVAPTLIYRHGAIAWNVDDGAGRWRQDTPDGVVDAVSVGAGCIALRRDALARFANEGVQAFAEGHDGTGRLVESDDVGFSRRAGLLGLRIGADFTRLCDHRVTVGLGSLVKRQPSDCV